MSHVEQFTRKVVYSHSGEGCTQAPQTVIEQVVTFNADVGHGVINDDTAKRRALQDLAPDCPDCGHTYRLTQHFIAPDK